MMLLETLYLFVFTTHKEVYLHGYKMAAIFPDITSIFYMNQKAFLPKVLSILSFVLGEPFLLLSHWS